MLGAMSGNLIMPSLEPILLSSITLSNKVGKDTDRTITIRSHQDIVQAVLEHNPVKAEDAMLLHLTYCRSILNHR